MPFELLPFACGACLFFGRRFTSRIAVFITILVGLATTTLAGELLLPLPQAALALLRDSVAAGAGCLIARVIAQRTATQPQPSNEEK